MGLDEDGKFNFEKYKLLVHYVSNMGNIFWAVFGIFLAANAFMLIEYVGYLGSSKFMNPSFKVGAPIFAVVFNLFWLFISGRDIALRQISIEKAKRLVEKIDHDRGSCLEIWDKSPEIEDSGIKGVTGKWAALYVFMAFIYVIIAAWVILLWIYLSEFPRSFGLVDIVFIVILTVIFIVALADYYTRKKAIEGFKGTSKCKKNESEEDVNMGIEVVKEQLNGYRVLWGVLYAGLITGMFLSYTQADNSKIKIATIALFVLLVIVVRLYYGKAKQLRNLEEKLEVA